MPSIFISYRRSDSQEVVDHLYAQLVRVFGPRNVFKDDQVIQPGQDIRQQIHRALATVDVVLVVIGPGWASQRLFDANDYVRMEVESALYKEGCWVIPVLVKGADRPPAQAIPESILRLRDLKAVNISHSANFRSDIAQLSETIRQNRPSVAKGQAAVNDPAPPALSPGGRLAGAGCLVIFLIIFLVAGILIIAIGSQVVPRVLGMFGSSSTALTNCVLRVDALSADLESDSDPFSSGADLGSIPQGSEVQAFERAESSGATFYRVRYNGIDGWVNGFWMEVASGNCG
jgi:hypothetical protein